MSSDLKEHLKSLKNATISETLKYIKHDIPKTATKDDLIVEYERAMVALGMEKFLEKLDDAQKKKTAKAVGAKNNDEIISSIRGKDLDTVLAKFDEDLIGHFCTVLNLGDSATGSAAKKSAIRDEITLIGGLLLLQKLTGAILKKHCSELGLKSDGKKEKVARALHDFIFDLDPEEDKDTSGKEDKDGEEALDYGAKSDKKRKADVDDDDDKHKKKRQKTDDSDKKKKEAEKKKKDQEKEKEKKKKEAEKKKKDQEKEKEKKKKEAEKKKKEAEKEKAKDSSEDSSSEDDKPKRTRGRPSKTSSSRSKSSKSKSPSSSSSSSSSKSKSKDTKTKDTKTKTTKPKAKKAKTEPAPKEKSPDIKTIVKGKYSADDLQNKFYVDDLKEYCKVNKIGATHLKKSIVIKAIVDFLETGEAKHWSTSGPRMTIAEKRKRQKEESEKRKAKKEEAQAKKSESGESSKKRKDAPSSSTASPAKKARTDGSGSDDDKNRKSTRAKKP